MSVDIDTITDSLSSVTDLRNENSSPDNSIVTDYLESDNIIEDNSGSTHSLNTMESTLATNKRCGSTVISHDSGVDMRQQSTHSESKANNRRRNRPKAAGRQRSAALPSPFLV